MYVTIVLLPGDGVGPEVTAAARTVLERAGEFFGHRFRFIERAIGGAAIDATGDPLPPETADACAAADAVFLGAVGGPKWEQGGPRPEAGLLALRKRLGLFANLRPIRVMDGGAQFSPLKSEIVRGADLLVVRELTGGVYFGEKKREGDKAWDVCTYTVAEIERIARVAFEAARDRRHHVTSVDKANVMETGRLWREVVTRIGRDEFPDIDLDHALVDSTAMQIVKSPRSFDVILTENMFGDILSDEAACLPGTIGVLPSASIGAGDGPGLFEPIHGSAPDLAGRDVANPVGAILSAAMLMRHGLAMPDEAKAVETAVNRVVAGGHVTRDLGGTTGTAAFAELVAKAIEPSHWAKSHRVQMHWA